MKIRNKPFRLISCSVLISIFCFSCSSDEDSISNYQESVISYFNSVALGFEYGSAPDITRKWMGTMKIFVGGAKNNSTLLSNVNETVAGINSLATDGFTIEVTTDSAGSNCYLFLGSREKFLERFPEASSSLGTNLALFDVWWNNNVINKARIFIDIQTTSAEQQKSLILEEVTQATGLGRDSPRYPDSIFYETTSDGGFAVAYSDRDRDLVRLLYHPLVTVGLDKNQVDKIIRKIFEQENR